MAGTRFEAGRRRGESEQRPGSARLRDALAFQRRPVETLARRRRADGRLFQLTSAVAGRMLVVGAPELAREVLHAPPGTFLTGAANRRILPVLQLRISSGGRVASAAGGPGPNVRAVPSLRAYYFAAVQ